MRLRSRRTPETFRPLSAGIRPTPASGDAEAAAAGGYGANAGVTRLLALVGSLLLAAALLVPSPGQGDAVPGDGLVPVGTTPVEASIAGEQEVTADVAPSPALDVVGASSPSTGVRPDASPADGSSAASVAGDDLERATLEDVARRGRARAAARAAAKRAAARAAARARAREAAGRGVSRGRGSTSAAADRPASARTPAPSASAGAPPARRVPARAAPRGGAAEEFGGGLD